MEKKFFDAMATLIGTTIGAGVLGIPFVVAQAGMPLGLISIIIIGAAIITLNLYLGEIALRTKGNHQLTGYAQRYLGKTGKRLMAATMVFVIYGAMTAYTIGTGEALASMLPSLGATMASVLFFAAGAAIIYVGIKAVQESEFLLTAGVIAVLALISIIAVASQQFDATRLQHYDLSRIAMPYGVILFAFLGTFAIPEMNEELGRKKRMLKKAIIFAGIVPIIGYSLFAAAIAGVTGTETSQVATIGLGKAIGPEMIVFANLFAVFAMATSFLALGLALKEMYQYDYGIGGKIAWLATVIVPISAFLLGVKEFIAVVGIVGAIAGGTEGVMIVLMHARAKKLGQRKPEYSIKGSKLISSALILMFIAGMVYGVFF